MFSRVAVDFARGGLKYFVVQSFGKTQHIIRAENAGFGRLHGIPLVMDRRCRTCQVIDLVHFHEERMRDIMPKQLKMLVVEQMLNVSAVRR